MIAWKLVCRGPTNKDSLLHNHDAIIKTRKSTLSIITTTNPIQALPGVQTVFFADKWYKPRWGISHLDVGFLYLLQPRMVAQSLLVSQNDDTVKVIGQFICRIFLSLGVSDMFSWWDSDWHWWESHCRSDHVLTASYQVTRDCLCPIINTNFLDSCCSWLIDTNNTGRCQPHGTASPGRH